jgi:hypothetical protein
MTIFLDLRLRLKEKLWAHLLQNDVEQVAFVFAAVESSRSSMMFMAQDAYFAPSHDLEFQSSFHVELTDDARARIIKRAWDTNAALVEFHSHPADRHKAMFSPSDMAGLAEFVPHCRWRLRGRPYLAVLVNRTTVDALAWITHSGEAVALDAIRVHAGKKIVPTNQTITSIQLEEIQNGPRTL